MGMGCGLFMWLPQFEQGGHENVWDFRRGSTGFRWAEEFHYSLSSAGLTHEIDHAETHSTVGTQMDIIREQLLPSNTLSLEHREYAGTKSA